MEDHHFSVWKYIRGPYKTFSLEEKREIINYHNLNESTFQATARHFKTSERHIKSILGKEELKSSGRVSKYKNENEVLFKRAFEFFKVFKKRPCIKSLAFFYLDKDDFFKSNGSKSFLTAKLIEYLKKHASNEEEKNLMRDKPLRRKKTLEYLGKLPNTKEKDDDHEKIKLFRIIQILILITLL